MIFLFSKFSLNAQQILFGAKYEMMMLNHPYIGTEHLFLSILKNSNLSLCKILNKYNIYYDNYKLELLKIFPKCKHKALICVYTPLLKKIIMDSTYNTKNNIIYPNDLFNSLISNSDGVGIQILVNMGINYNKFYKSFKRYISNSNNFNFLSTYGVNMNINSYKYEPVYYRDKIINNIFEVLCRKNKNNPLLIGKAGTGKTAIVEEIARRINNKECPSILSSYTIINIPISNIVSGTKYRGEFEERFGKILKEASTNKVILFIDEVHTIIHAGGAEGAIDAGNILKPYLARGDIKVIGATTYNEYHESIHKDSALNRRFQIVNVPELDYNATLSILYKLKDNYSKYHNISIPISALKYIAYSSIKYLPNLVNPDKSIDILDLASVKTSLKSNSYEKTINKYKCELKDIIKKKDNAICNNDFNLANKCKLKEFELKNNIDKLYVKSKSFKNILTISTIDEVIKEKTGGFISNYSYKNFYDFLSSNIVSNSDNIKSICSFFKVISTSRRDNPYSFLFMGSNGVGKSFIAKLISDYFHLNYIYINDFSSFDKLLNKVSLFPNSVILFDEIENFDKNIKIINNIIKYGYIEKDNNKIYFNGTIIFMSTNINVSSNIGFNNSISYNSLYDYFGDVFIKNIDKIYKLCDLEYEDVYKIVSLKLKKYNIKCNQSNIEYVINRSDYKCCGASKIDKIIKSDLIAHKNDTNKSVI